MPFLPRLPSLVLALLVTVAARSSSSGPTTILANDNRIAAGDLRDGVLHLSLRVGLGDWHPDAEDGPRMVIQAFGESGSPLRNPGPLIRVRAGTTVDITLSNELSDSAVELHGLHDRPGSDSAILVAPGATRHVRFTLRAPGTYYYWGTTEHRAVDARDDIDSQLAGAIIVDAPGAPVTDRIFVLGLWFRAGDDHVVPAVRDREIMVINGKAFPFGDSVVAYRGDTLTWRVLNPTSSSHPMHLHGFYFTVHSVGDGDTDTLYSRAADRMANTELMLPGSTMRMTWTPSRAGNWLFHCHFAAHVSRLVSLTQFLADSADSMRAMRHFHAMSGLVIPIQVLPRGNPPPVVATAPVRDIRLFVDSAPHRWGPIPAIGFAVQDGAVAPAEDSVTFPGPTLVLRRGQPVRMHVINRLAGGTSVHWHGIELESFPDGVPHFSGAMDRQFTEVAPRDSFVAEFTPPRAGTFIYHTHFDELHQLNDGMFGPLVVTESGALDAASDRVVIVGPAGEDGHGVPPATVNGTQFPDVMHLVVGKAYRFRLINIQPDWRVVFSIVTDSTVERWTPVAKDGADLPVAQRVSRAATLLTGPGETADFLFTPRHAGRYRLDVESLLSGWYIPVGITAR